MRPARPDEITVLVAIDDDACTLFDEVGRDVNLPPEHASFMLAEHARWRETLEAGRIVMAVNANDEPVGFAALSFVDGQPYLQQVSVRRSWMRRGLGRALVDDAIRRAPGALWLTTYADIVWNQPLYERLGFSRVDEASCGPEMRRLLDEERRALPCPEQRVVMVRQSEH